MKIPLFDRSFPVPKYLRLDPAGLDISDKSVKVVKMKKDGGGLRPVYFASETIEPGLIVNGSIENKEALVVVFQKIKEKHKLEFVTVSLPEEKAYVFNVLLPMEVKNIREALELQIEEHVPFPSDHVIFDYEILETHKNGKIIVSVSAISKQVAEDYANVLTEAGITPFAFEIEAHSLSRALVPFDDHDTYMIVDFGQTRSGFSIVSEGRVRFSSTISIGGDNVVKAIAQKFELSEQLARKMKEERGIERRGDEELFFTLTPVMSVLRDEISKFEMYWDSRKEEFGGERPHIKHIILCGGDANTPGLIDYLSSGSAIPYKLANPWINILSFDEFIPEIDSKESLRYASAIGLALRRYSDITQKND